MWRWQLATTLGSGRYTRVTAQQYKSAAAAVFVSCATACNQSHMVCLCFLQEHPGLWVWLAACAGINRRTLQHTHYVEKLSIIDATATVLCCMAWHRWLEVLRCISRWELLQQIASGMPTDAVLFAAGKPQQGSEHQHTMCLHCSGQTSCSQMQVTLSYTPCDTEPDAALLANKRHDLLEGRLDYALAALSCHGSVGGTVPGDKGGTGRAAAAALKEQLKKHITGAMPAAVTPTSAAAAAAEAAGEYVCLAATE